MTDKTKGILRSAVIVVGMLIGAVVALLIATVIQFGLHFFGATMITFQDMVGLWFGFPCVFALIGGFVASILTSDW